MTTMKYRDPGTGNWVTIPSQGPQGIQGPPGAQGPAGSSGTTLPTPTWTASGATDAALKWQIPGVITQRAQNFMFYTANRWYYFPMYAAQLVRLVTFQFGLQAAGISLRLALYACDRDGQPGALFKDLGLFTVNNTSGTLTLPANTTFTGQVLLGMNANFSGNWVASIGNPVTGSMPLNAGPGGAQVRGIYGASTFGVPPDPGVKWTSFENEGTEDFMYPIAFQVRSS